MQYFPFLDIYEKYKTHINDMLFYMGVYLLLVVFDPVLTSVYWLNPRVSVLAFVFFIYTATFFITRRYKLHKLFSGPFAHGYQYTIFLGITTAIFYMIFVRPRFQ